MFLLKIFVLISSICVCCESFLSERDQNFKLIILHNNDMHARFDQINSQDFRCSEEEAKAQSCYGGFARIATVVNDYRKRSINNEIPPVLFLNAGDTYSGSIWFTIYKENITADFLNKIRPDVMTLGNHEFDEGVESLAIFLEQLEFPVVAANVDISKVPSLNTGKLKNSTVIVKNGIKIGIIGYLTPETKRSIDASIIDITEEIDAVNYESHKLKLDGVDIIIALGHSGLDKDKLIAYNCPDIDLVIGGHSHSLLYNGQPPKGTKAVGPYPLWITQKSGRQVPVVQASSFTKYLGILDLEFDRNGEIVNLYGSPLLLNSSIAQNSEVLELFDKYNDNMHEWINEAVGESSEFINGYCRRTECSLGNMFTDAMLQFYSFNISDKSVPELSLANAGVIRSSINKGDITREDLLNVFPYGNHIVVLTASGKEILETLEHSVARYRAKGGRSEFLQMSGISVTFDFSKSIGKRVVEVQVQEPGSNKFKEINENGEYRIVMPSYLAEGGDGFIVFKNKTMVDLGIIDVDLLAEYLKNNSPVNPTVTGRIKIINPLI